ncbi:MAG: hypothetical protein JO199_08900, partial [Candidatus Eremiobacteraeota bacterium]|nr:hypothetical protein [Candidatus Eremiobacteraeota bacterium]
MTAARLRTYAIPVTLLVAGLAAIFASAIPTYFALDDFFWLYTARFPMSTFAGWLSAFTVNVGPFYRPLSQNVYFWLSYHLFGFHPLGFHVLCAAALVAAALFAYASYRRLLPVPAAALVAACAFAFSHTHYETVAWASAFDEASAAAVFAAAIFAYVSGRGRLAIALYVVALLCDESATPLPAIALLLSLLVFRKSVKNALHSTAWLWMAFVIYAAFRLFVTGLGSAGASAFSANTDPSLYASLLFQSIGNAFGWTPNFDNVMRSGPPWGWTATLAWATYLVLVATLFVTALIGRNRGAVLRAACAGMLWFVVAL